MTTRTRTSSVEQGFSHYRKFTCFQRGVGVLTTGQKLSQSTWHFPYMNGQVASFLINIAVGPTTLSARISAFDQTTLRWNFIHDLFAKNMQSKQLIYMRDEDFAEMPDTPEEIEADEKALLEYVEKLLSGKVS